MVERLGDKIETIHADHKISPDALHLMQAKLDDWERYPELVGLMDVGFIRGIPVENGANPSMLANSAVIPPEIFVVDKRIPDLCMAQYLRGDDRLLACGGVRRQRSACPPYAPKPEETQEVLLASEAVVVVQAHGLTEYDHQKQLHHTLLAIESFLETRDFDVTGSWTAGPCRLCEPRLECLGQGKCRNPELIRYSMEGSGIAVFLTCDRIAEISQDDSWRMELIENWGLENQSSETFKSVIAIAVE